MGMIAYQQHLGPLDWLVISLYFLGMLFVGWWYSRKDKTTEDYMLGGRKMKSWNVGLSLFATLFSSITYLSNPGEMIKHGPMLWCMMAAYPLAYLVVGYLLIPHIMTLRISSAYELLEIKLGTSVRLLGSALFLITRLVWMGVIIYMCAEKIIVPIMGWSEKTALWVSIFMGVITVVYTSMGGIRGVVLTDVIQSYILFLGAILSIGLVCVRLGSPMAWVPDHWIDHWAPWKFFDTTSRVTFLGAVISTFSWFVCTAGSDQMAIQRYLSTADAKTARRAYLASLVATACVVIILGVLGLSLLAYFQNQPGSIMGGRNVTEAADLLFPHFIVSRLPMGFSGLILAGLMAAAMSSLASGINSSGLVIIEDFIFRFSRMRLAETQRVVIAKAVSFSIGVVMVLLSLLMDRVKGNLLEVTYKTSNLLVAPLFVPFFMAMFVRRATEWGTFLGTIVSVVVCVLVGFSAELFRFSISFLWIMPLGFVSGVLASLIFSMFLGQPKSPLVPEANVPEKKTGQEAPWG
jgi:solute:Na+ symporter, SSS family